MLKRIKSLKNVVRQLKGDYVIHGALKYGHLLDAVNRLDFSLLSDEQLEKMSEEIKNSAAQMGIKEEFPEDLVVKAFALAREACKRVLGLRPFDVQVIGAIAMHYGNVIEMQTGEGKTLTAVLTAYLNALGGKGVHVLTFNDYLAKRDAEWMGPVYRFLGLTVGSIHEKMKPEERKKAYACDITYLTAKEAGFDYLRGFLCTRKDELVHRTHHFALIDEADSILIDEARIPLVIAGDVPEKESYSSMMAKLVRKLIPGIHYRTDEYERNVFLTEAGIERAEALIGCGNLYDTQNYELLTSLNCALHAEALLKKDVDYIVRNRRIELVDEFTGRIADKRHWPDGLQAAVEAKEGLEVDSKGMILYSITMQNYIKQCRRICGMTGTARTAVNEFKELYGLDVVEIPTNKPCIRVDAPDVIFFNKTQKQKALISEITRVHAAMRPVLIGTISVEESEQLALELRNRGISCHVLNARNDEMEAKIIANAGLPGAVTVSTNMAGRGVDIKLGGKDEEERDRVVSAGGLYVIGTNRHESRRVDNQLKGRAGRQGDPGTTRFFISLEDDLMLRYKVDELLLGRYRPGPHDKPLESPVLRREIARTQRIIEGQNFEIRKTLIRYSHILEAQRRIIHKRCQEILMGSATLNLLSTRFPKQYSELTESVGSEVLQQVEAQITLHHIKQSWAGHLDYASYVREGIHLMNMAGKSPIDEFNKIIIEAFDKLQEQIDDEIVNTFERAEITESGIDMEKEGLKGPSSTWTYMVNDSPEQLGIMPILRNPMAVAVNWPLILGIGIFNRFFKNKQSKKL